MTGLGGLGLFEKKGKKEAEGGGEGRESRGSEDEKRNSTEFKPKYSYTAAYILLVLSSTTYCTLGEGRPI